MVGRKNTHRQFELVADRSVVNVVNICTAVFRKELLDALQTNIEFSSLDDKTC